MRRGLGFHNRHSPGGFSPLSLFAGGINGTWYDPSDATTLFSDRAGTTPCATPGAGAVVPVGLMLDKSQGLTLGSELMPANDASNWTAYSANTVANDVDGSVLITYVNNQFGASLPLSVLIPALLNVAKTFEITYEVKVNTGSANVRMQNFVGNAITSVAVTSTVYVAQQFIGCWDGSGGIVLDFTNLSAGKTINIRNISVRELPGNHAIAANDTTARPELSARVNLLTYSEQFENGVWDKLNGVTISQNAAIAPDGTTTADKLIAPNSTGIGRTLRQYLTSGVNGVSYVSSFYAKYVSGEFAWIRALGTDAGVVWFDIQNGVRGTVTGANTTGTITSVGNGWYRCVITSTANSTNIYSYLNPVDADGSSTTTGDGSKGVLIWGADLRPTNIGSQIPAYQRVADQYTYDTVGFPRFLRALGASTGMYTPSTINLGGNKVTAFAGVRKQSDAALGVIMESSATIASNNGAFLLSAPNSAAANYNFSSKGTTQVDNTVTTFTAPLSSVLSGQGDIGAPSNVIRVNGVATTVTSTQGTGNYGTYSLNLFGRNSQSGTPTAGTILNGDLYSVILVAGSTGQVAATEQWIAGKMSITI